MSKPQIFVSHQGCIPAYRCSFFARLNELDVFDYVVIHGEPPSGAHLLVAQPPYPFPNLRIKNHEIRVMGRSLIWQPIVWRAITGSFDAAIIGDEVKYASSLFVALALRLRGRPVILWGFGFHQYGDRQISAFARLTAALAAGIKKCLYRLVSGYLAYTEGGERALHGLIRHPKRIAVVRNTIDTEREFQLRRIVASERRDSLLAQFRARSSKVVFLYFGQLIPRKGVDVLVQYARHSFEKHGDRVDIIISGRGPEEPRLRALAEGLPNVSFHSLSDLDLARALHISTAVVIPGIMGLAVTHAFAHGVPIVTRRGQLHSPEVEYIQDEINGLVLPEVPDEFFQALDAFVDDPGLQRRLAAGAERTARTIDMSHMVKTFHGVVAECLADSGNGSSA
jgi:glycosyltransferase involved in cell wall biosynthesis